jgi:hypothetical protein
MRQDYKKLTISLYNKKLPLFFDEKKIWHIKFVFDVGSIVFNAVAIGAFL